MRDVLAKIRECGKDVKMRDFPHDCGMVDTYVREMMELFCAGDVNRPTMFLALASVAAACNRYPQATTTVIINGFYPEYGTLILVKTQIICM